jgi:hypothetical protein
MCRDEQRREHVYHAANTSLIPDSKAKRRTRTRQKSTANMIVSFGFNPPQPNVIFDLLFRLIPLRVCGTNSSLVRAWYTSGILDRAETLEEFQDSGLAADY